MPARGGGAVDPALDARLQLALGWTFVDHDLLDRARTHRSYCAEHGVEESNERLEFLGDSVLGLVVTRFVFQEYPRLPEGELAKLRASVVSAETLSEVAQELDLGASLRLGKGEDASGGRAKPSILADAMEAVIAAVYLRDEEYGAGEGRSKKAAEQAAARIAWERLQREANGASSDRADRIGVGDA
jgi:dsRNA-specific ribonuclease